MKLLLARVIISVSVFAIIILALIGLAIAFGWEVGTVVSGSMEPSLGVGDVALCRPVSADSIQTGDIIAYQSLEDPDTTITHRVTNVLRSEDDVHFQTWGDANRRPDELLVPSENVKGKIVFHLPYLGYLVSFLKTPGVLLTLIVLPLILIIVIKREDLRALFVGDEEATAAQ